MALPSNTGQIVIDQVSNVTNNSGATGSLQHSISSQDAVLLVLVNGSSTASSITVQVNGTQIPLVGLTGTTGSGVAAFYTTHPPVGMVTITTADGVFTTQTMAVSLLGVDKTTPNLITASSTGVGAAVTTSPQVAAANSLIIDMIQDTNLEVIAPININQTVLWNGGVSGVTQGYSSYMVASPGVQTMSWPTTGNTSALSVVLEPAHAPSISFPSIDTRNINDVVGPNGLQTRNFGTAVTPLSFGNKQTTFWQNSFLHTVGRIISPPQAAGLAAEVQLETSQIVIDRVSQVAAASAASATVDHVVSYQDAVMVVFASNMGVIQGLNTVTLNGAPLNSQIQNNISSVVGGVYFINNPPVGVNTLAVNVTLPAALELVVFTLLGVDKRVLQPVVSTNSGASGSPSLAITPTAANSLIIDYVGTLIGSGTEDTSQTPYFDQPQTASGAFGSYKLSTNSPQTMAWTTLGAAWVQLAIALEPANALSMWYPAVDVRNLSDVVPANGLDSSTNPQGSFTSSFGAHPAQFYQNSFLHTIGRLPLAKIVAPVSFETPEYMLMGMGS